MFYGMLRVVVGPMFSSKTTELIRMMKTAETNSFGAQAFRPTQDDRHIESCLRSHDGEEYPATLYSVAGTVLDSIRPGVKVLGFEELHLADPAIFEVILELLQRGYGVEAVGCDLDHFGKPMEPLRTLMAYADEVLKLHADCEDCGLPARFSEKLEKTASVIDVGGKDKYLPKCRRHFHPTPSGMNNETQVCPMSP